MSGSRRILWVEAARTLACVLVVLAHVNIYTRAGIETWWPGGFFLAPVLALAVPVFFVIAGYMADLSATREHSAGWLGTRMRRLLLPFFVWNALTLIALAATRAPVSPGSAALQLLTGTWHLYFLFALAQLLVLHALLLPVLELRLRWVVALSLLVTALAFGTSEALLWTRGAGNGMFEVEAKKAGLFWAAFFATGVWWRRRGSAIASRRGVALLGATALASFLIYVADLRLEDRVFSFTPRKQLLAGGLPFQLLGAIGGLALLQGWERAERRGRLLESIAAGGRDTFGIYLAHICVLVLLWKLWQLVGGVSMHWGEIPLFTLATWLVSRALVWLVRVIRVPWLSLALLGERPPGIDASRRGVAAGQSPTDHQGSVPVR